MLVALLVASPLYFSAKLEKLATIMDMDEVSDILVCRQSWNPLWRMVYNGAACAFQFFLPIGFVVRSVVRCVSGQYLDLGLSFKTCTRVQGRRGKLPGHSCSLSQLLTFGQLGIITFPD